MARKIWDSWKDQSSYPKKHRPRQKELDLVVDLPIIIWNSIIDAFRSVRRFLRGN